MRRKPNPAALLIVLFLYLFSGAMAATALDAPEGGGTSPAAAGEAGDESTPATGTTAGETQQPAGGTQNMTPAAPATQPAATTPANVTPEEMESMRREIADLKKRVTELEEKTDTTYGLKISGFFDVYASNYENQPNIFEIGSFEIDLQHSYKENLQVAAAIVFDRGATLDVGFIDYHLYGGSVNPRGRMFESKGLHLQVGKFDVPLGNDWQYFTAVNRMTVTPPLTTDIVMEGGYNDVGMRLLWNYVAANLSLCVLRGIEEGYSYGGNSAGARIGITPFNTPFQLKSRKAPPLEVGFSYLHDFDSAGRTSEQLFVADAESTLGPVFLTGEFYNRDKKVGIIHRGFHITGAYDFRYSFQWPVKVYTRFDMYNMIRYGTLKENNSATRLTAGVNINIYKVSYLKIEYLHFLTSYQTFMEEEYYSPDLFYIQLMIAF